MVNRINIFQPDAPMSYDDRIDVYKRQVQERPEAVRERSI